MRIRLKKPLIIPKGAFSWTKGDIAHINQIRQYAHNAAIAIDRINRSTHPDELILQYLTPYCVECGEIAQTDEFHVIYDGFVLICCEDYKMIPKGLIGENPSGTIEDGEDWLTCGFCMQLQNNCSCEDKWPIAR